MNQQTQETTGTERPIRRRFIALGVVGIIVIGVFFYWLATRGWVATDDAQVTGNLVPISPRVSGYIKDIYIKDNESVTAGETLLQLDSRDLQSKLTKNEADLAVQQSQASAASEQVSLIQQTSTAGAKQAGAAANVADAGIAAAQSQITAAQAQVEAAQASASAAHDAVGSARADVQSASAQIEAAQAGVEAAQADLSSAQAQAQKVSADAARAKKLFEKGAISRQTLDASTAANTSAGAAVKAAEQRVNSALAMVKQNQAKRSSNQAALKQAVSRAKAAEAMTSQAKAAANAAHVALAEAKSRYTGALASEQAADTAPQQIGISKSQNSAANAKIRQSQADISNAKLQLSYTRIFAPVSGIVSQKNAQPGQYVQPGQMLMAVVPLDDVWVLANFKETQIDNMRPGQEVRLDIDTYHGDKITGKVDSIGAATGAKFSLLPAENATGNFVKVVQRIPVKIIINTPLPKGVILRPGMNVTARVHVMGGRNK